jgi:hypothetical protein
MQQPQQPQQPGQQEQWQPALAAAPSLGLGPGSASGAAAESPIYPPGLANVGLLHLGLEQRQEEAPDALPDGTRALLQQLGRQIRSQQPQLQKEEHEEDAATTGSEQVTPLLHAITALLGPVAQQPQQQQQAYHIEQLGAALFALAQQHQEQREQLRQQQEHMHTQQQHVTRLQEQVQQQAGQHRKLEGVVSALGAALDSLGGGGGGGSRMPGAARHLWQAVQLAPPPPQQQQQQQMPPPQQQPPIASSNGLQGMAQAEAASTGVDGTDAASLRRLPQVQQLVQLYRAAPPPASAAAPAPDGQSGGGTGQLPGAAENAGAGASTATDGSGGRKRPRDDVNVSVVGNSADGRSGR